ncbi:MAG: radical SAM protein, partial [Bdellovibrionales bacterium]|nr:radical SAM protein [Bdellovibrionales bacterium]
REMHVEITSRCNAACHMCTQNHFGGKDKEGIELSDWTADEAEKVFDQKFKNLRNILFCGTHGAPVAAKDCLSIVETARRQTSATIEFYSNASLRNKSWWGDLGKILKVRKYDDYYRNSDLGIFSIDGLADTNHLYRRRTNFEKIIENAEEFIRQGGRARWDYIVFKHNEHQVEEAEILAKKIGFKQFRIRKTSRFAYSPDGPLKHRVLNNSGEIEYYLEPATKEEYLNKNKKKYEELLNKEKNNQLDFEEKIQCLNKTEFQRLYISAQLKVFPCCFISNDTYPGKGKVFQDTKEKVVQHYGSDFNSLKHKTWDEIIDHPWFKNELVESWSKNEEKLIRCQRTCSVKCNPITSQSQDQNI